MSASSLHDCPELTRVLDGEADPRHLAICTVCSELAEDFEHLQAQAELLPKDGWADQPPVEVDVEAALAQVLAGARPGRRRARRGVMTLRLLTTAAALLLVFSIGAPVVLRHRIEQSASTLPLTAGDDGVLFFTSYGPQR